MLKPLLFLLLLTGAAFARAAGSPEEELRALEETRRAAIKAGDFTTLGLIYAEDFSGIVGNGRIVDRAFLFEVFKHNNPDVVFTTDEITVRVFGDTALFVGRLVGRTPEGKVVSAGRFTHTFVRRAGTWACVAGQSTPLAITESK